MGRLICGCLFLITSFSVWASCPDAQLICFTTDSSGRCVTQNMGTPINTYNYGGVCVPKGKPTCDRIRACNAVFRDFAKEIVKYHKTREIFCRSI